MSWISRHALLAQNECIAEKWICDHCCEVYRAEEREPAYTFEEPQTFTPRRHFKVMAGRRGINLEHSMKTERNRLLWDVHYCCEACAEPYVTAAVAEGLVAGED